MACASCGKRAAIALIGTPAAAKRAAIPCRVCALTRRVLWGVFVGAAWIVAMYWIVRLGP